MVRSLAGYDAPFGFAGMGIVYGPVAAALPLLSAGVSAVSGIGSTIVGMQGAKAQGRAAMEAANYRAIQLRQQAQEARASTQRAALETRRKTERAQGTLIARAAAGGGGTTDETVLGLSGQIAQRGEYEALLDMYKGENAARGYEDAATAALYGGQVAKEAANINAGSALMSGIGSIASSVGSFGKAIGNMPSFSGVMPGTTLPSATNWDWGTDTARTNARLKGYG